MITIALSKGRLMEETAELFTRAGIDCAVLNEDTRKLVLKSMDGKYGYILVKPSDVLIYVERGVADIGICGKDVLLENSADVYEMADLKIGVCDMCVAGDPKVEPHLKPIVATKFPKIAREYYDSKGIDIDLVKLNGSVELAAVIGLSDYIVDIVQSGKTLEANGLKVLEKVCAVSARLVVNKVALKQKTAEILPLITAVNKAVSEIQEGK